MKLEKLNMIIPGFPFHALADFLNSEHRRSLQILAFDITNIDVEEMATIVEQIGDHSLSLRKLVMVGKPTTWPLQSDWSMLCAVLQRIEVFHRSLSYDTRLIITVPRRYRSALPGRILASDIPRFFQVTSSNIIRLVYR